jgi:hypothetical protein
VILFTVIIVNSWMCDLTAHFPEVGVGHGKCGRDPTISVDGMGRQSFADNALYGIADIMRGSNDE